MALSGAERARRCREKKKAAGLSHKMKQKDRMRKKACLEYIFSLLKSLIPSLDEIIIISDGSSSQFKNQYSIKGLSILANQFSMTLSWHFFATSHGKGEYY
ncbi:unnamed protein product [Rotaria sp. Silwood2]|nr:unnamed protein product [Rotaria sp. Silwood2]CAF3406639.1 unnamed protein product [Rotaria sp. Silwood2]CAF4584744.1 unnamed protein product [Rotaria sp. Silwood2]CAF4627744.1 unnamed protein product [Rotaria sp. Silwood2]